MPRHIPLEFRPLIAVIAKLPFKAKCGEQMRDVGSGDPCRACERESILKSAGPSFDLKMEEVRDDGASEYRDLTPMEAVKQAEHLCNRDGFLSQDDYQHLLTKLEPKSHYNFRMGLIGHSIHIRTGAVNVVDRVEPGIGGLGDAGSANDPGLWRGQPFMNQPELNSSPYGSAESDFGKTRRTEGEKDAEFGNNLNDLTIASLQDTKRDRLVRTLNAGLGLEMSQHLRYENYAHVLRVAKKEELSESLQHLANRKAEAIRIMTNHIFDLGGKLGFTVEAAVSFSPSDPDVVGKILGELWRYEQSNFEHHIIARDIVAQTTECSDELYRVAELARTAGDIIPGSSEPNPSTATMWNDSYHNENAFEGLDKMGENCHNCGHPLEMNDVVPCPLCESGRMAVRPRPACFNCAGSGKIAICECGQAHFVESEYRPAKRWAAWRRKADAVKRVTRFADIPVHIEYNTGDVKTYPDGNSRKYNASYGFIPGTIGADNEPLDVFLGDYPAHKAYIVSQLKQDGTFDEEKVMLGFRDASTAEAIYRSHHPNNAKAQFGGMREMGLEGFIADYVLPEREDAYQPKLMMKQVPIHADHGPGDSDGCDTGTPALGGNSSSLRDLVKTDPKVKDFVKMVQDPKALGTLAKDKPDFPIANMKGAPKMPEGINTLGDVLKAMEAPTAPPVAKPKAPKVPKPKPSGNKSVDHLQDTVAKAINGEPADLSAAKSDPVTGTVATQIEKMLSNPEMAEKTRGLLTELLAKGPPTPEPQQTPKAPNVQKAPVQAPGSVPHDPLPNVDTSPVISPAEEAWKREAGELTKAWNQMWKLIGGPEFQPNTFKGSKQADMPTGVQPEEQYDQPVSGVFPEMDGHQEELTCIHASLDIGMDALV
jgi:hypothetical protein